MLQQIIITKKQLDIISGGLTEEITKPVTLRAYSFDWDDNVINMPTTIKLLKKTGSGWEKVNLGTSEYALIRNDENYKLDDGAFDNFISDESFLSDLQIALDNRSFAPSFEKFKEALIYANPISIITARGNNPEVIRKGMDLVIANTFNDRGIGYYDR